MAKKANDSSEKNVHAKIAGEITSTYGRLVVYDIDDGTFSTSVNEVWFCHHSQRSFTQRINLKHKVVDGDLVCDAIGPISRQSKKLGRKNVFHTYFFCQL